MIMNELTRTHLIDLGYEARVSETGRDIKKSDLALRPTLSDRFFDHVVKIARGKGQLQVTYDYKTRQVCIFANCPAYLFAGCTENRIYYLCRDMTEMEIGCIVI